MRTKKDGIINNFSLGSVSPVEKWLVPLHEGVIKVDQPIPKSQKEKFFILQSNPEFFLRRASIRTKFGLFTGDFEDYFGWAEKLYEEKELGKTKDDFDKEIRALMHDFHIGQRWQQAIEYYVIFNKHPEHLIPPALDFYVDSNFHTISLKINRGTTLDDIKENWREIEKNKHYLEVLSDKYETDDGEQILKRIKPKKYSTIREFQKYKKASQLNESGLKYAEIAKRLGINDYSTVGVYIKRFKEAIKENELY